jgi:hypothetical protein
MLVTLNVQEAITAATIGMRRQIFAMSKSLRHYGKADLAKDDDVFDLAFDHHIFGAMAEFAVAKALNMFWAPNVGIIDGVDVGGRVEVRVRKIPGTGTDLAIRQKDTDGRPYVLALSRRDFSFDLVGWLYAEEGKGKGTFCEARQVWFVPPPYRSIEELAEIVRAQTVAA